MDKLKLLFDKKNRASLLTIVGMLIILPLILAGIRYSQLLKKEAAGSGEVNINFAPESGTLSRSQTISINVNILKNSTVARSIAISGAQGIIFVSDKFEILGALCESPFNGLPFTRIDGQTVTLLCAISATSTPVSLSENQPISFGTLNLRVKPDAVFGDAPLTIANARITEAGVLGQAPDVSAIGQVASYAIAQTPTPTVEISITPQPSVTIPPQCNQDSDCDLINPIPPEVGDCVFNRCLTGHCLETTKLIGAQCTRNNQTGVCQEQGRWCIIPTTTPQPSTTPIPPTATIPVPTSTVSPSVPVATVTPGGPTTTPGPSSTPSPTPRPCPHDQKARGDANCDGRVDGIDYSIWLSTQCHRTDPDIQICGDLHLQADFNFDGNIDDADYDIWFTNSRSQITPTVTPTQ